MANLHLHRTDDVYLTLFEKGQHDLTYKLMWDALNLKFKHFLMNIRFTTRILNQNGKDLSTIFSFSCLMKSFGIV